MPVLSVKVSKLNIAYRSIIHLFSANYYSTIILGVESYFMLNVRYYNNLEKNKYMALRYIHRDTLNYRHIPIFCKKYQRKSVGKQKYPVRSEIDAIIYKQYICFMSPAPTSVCGVLQQTPLINELPCVSAGAPNWKQCQNFLFRTAIHLTGATVGYECPRVRGMLVRTGITVILWIHLFLYIFC